MKKNIEWLKKEIGNMPYTRLKRVGIEDYVAINKSGVFELINQLDETEVLSEEWVKGHEQQVHPDHPSNAWWVASDDLQGLFVLKQGEIDQAYKDGYEKGKEQGFYKGYREGLANKGGKPETVSDVVANFYEACERLQGVMSMEVEELEE